MKKLALALAFLSATSLLHSQETRYITDELAVQLRTGPTFNHRILKGLTSGARLSVLETSEDQNWIRVKTGDLEGWIPAQYAVPEPAARDVLKSVNQRLERLQQENTELKSRLAATTQQEQQLQSQLSDVDSQNAKLTEELHEIKSVSANAIQLHNDNQRLLQENQVLKNQADMLTADNQRLADARSNDQFMNGAFAVLIGVFITLLVPRLWPKKRSDWA